MNRKYKTKICPDCGVEFTPTGSTSKRCSDCQEVHTKLLRQIRRRKRTKKYIYRLDNILTFSD